MAYADTQEIINSFKYLFAQNMKLNTFFGLMCLLGNSVDRTHNYIKSDMTGFSKDMDLAFYLNSDLPERHGEKYWYALFHQNWFLGIKKHLLKNNKLSAKKSALVLFWYISFDNSDELLNYFKNRINNDEIFDLFFEDKNEDIVFSDPKCPKRQNLFQGLNGKDTAYTISLDKGEFLEKKAGDLGAAPYAQTLYSNTNLKKYFSTYDFDFIAHYHLKRLSQTVLILKPILNSLTIVPKSFILLAGISGTGKTRFVKEQASYFTDDLSNYCLVSVRPDWHEPSDLLGYISRLGNNGARYITTDFLRFMVAAWKHRADHKDDSIPYWLCLDEMNLAPVEQYFADYLSIIETRYWDEAGDYHGEALLPPGVFKQLDDKGLDDLQNSLGLAEHKALWDEFIKIGIRIPPNLMVAGTVNMDETTHGFSRKVIDRAFTLDFGEFFPNNYQAYFQPTSRPKPLGFPTLSQVTSDAIAHVSADADGKNSIAFLEAINSVLKSTPFELAYRALNELLIAVVCFAPEDERHLQAVWDDFLMTKVLPRIEGDSEKLQDDGENSLLLKLEKSLSIQLATIWADDLTRPDLLRESFDGELLPGIQCRSKKKLNWMQGRLTANGFTSFWP